MATLYTPGGRAVLTVKLNVADAKSLTLIDCQSVVVNPQ